MKLHENQLKLVRHLALFTLMEYTDCLDMLNTEGTAGRTALSSARPCGTGVRCTSWRRFPSMYIDLNKTLAEFIE